MTEFREIAEVVAKRLKMSIPGLTVEIADPDEAVAELTRFSQEHTSEYSVFIYSVLDQIERSNQQTDDQKPPAP